MLISTLLPEPPPIGNDLDLPWLVAKYTFATDPQLTAAYSDVAKGLAIFEETPRGNLGLALRQHLNIIVAEQQRRGSDTHQQSPGMRVSHALDTSIGPNATQA